MRESVFDGFGDFRCPHCGTCLCVDDPDDFYSEHRMEREEDFYDVCPVCDEEFAYHVTWEPTYSGARKLWEGE